MRHQFFPSLSRDCVTTTSENVPGSNPVVTLPTWLSDLLPCASTHVTVWLCSVVQSLSTSRPWRVVSWHLRIWIPVLFCFTIAVWVESVVQCQTGKHAIYFRYWCYPVICLEALKATTMKPQNTLCQGWESKFVPPEQERQLITHHDLLPWLIFGLFNEGF
jgi:hypothetical protein